MTEATIFIGLDVHKETIAMATVEARASADVRFFGTIANTPEAIRSVLRKLARGGQKLHLAHEVGPHGYTLYRQATGLGHRCDVVAPSLIPRKAGDKDKTDRRDAKTLAQTSRAGQLTEVWVPDEAHEAMRKDGPVAVWGAASKGVTFALLIDGIDCAIDLNPTKQNCFMPVSGTPIVSPDVARGRGITSIIVMNPNYEAEIRAKVQAMDWGAEVRSIR